MRRVVLSGVLVAVTVFACSGDDAAESPSGPEAPGDASTFDAGRPDDAAPGVTDAAPGDGGTLVVDGPSAASATVNLGCDVATSTCTLPVYNQVRVAFPSADAFLVAALPTVASGSPARMRIYHSTNRGQTARVFPPDGAAAYPGITLAPNTDLYATTLGASANQLVVVAVQSGLNEAGTGREDTTRLLVSSDAASTWQLAGGGLPIGACYVYSIVPNDGGWLLGGRCLRGSSWAWVVGRTNAAFGTFDVLDEIPGGTPASNISFVEEVLVAGDGCLYAGGAVDDAGVRRPVIRRSCAGGAWTNDYRPATARGAVRKLADHAGAVLAFAELYPDPATFVTGDTAILKRAGTLDWTSQTVSSASAKRPAFLEGMGAACGLVFGTSQGGAAPETDLRRTVDCGQTSTSFGSSTRTFRAARPFGAALRVADLGTDLQIRSVALP